MSQGKLFKDLSQEEKKLQILELKSFCRWFKKLFDLDIYLIYGTLLGAVREQDLIDNDNDIDVAYFSKYTSFEDVFKEMVMINIICANLKMARSFGEGSGLPQHSGHAHLYSLNKKYIFDVWTSWIDENGKYNFYVMGKNLEADLLLPFGEQVILGEKFLAPNKSEALLRFLYSEEWKIPMNRKSRYYNKTHWEPLIDKFKKDCLQ